MVCVGEGILIVPILHAEFESAIPLHPHPPTLDKLSSLEVVSSTPPTSSHIGQAEQPGSGK